jgi:hypothetical protein
MYSQTVQLLSPLTEILQLPPMLIPPIPPAAAVLEAIATVPVAVPVITIELMDMPE